MSTSDAAVCPSGGTPLRRSGRQTPPGAAGDHDSKSRLLQDLLSGVESIIVAFSGGVDSAYLAWAATQALGSSALCVTADSPSYPDHHRQLALDVAGRFGLRHLIIRTHELEQPLYRSNPANRCYYCKHELYTALSALARERGIPMIADGSTADDRGDYRPGRQAAREFGVRSPLDDAGLTKSEIRELSHRAGLQTWDEPASACLSSRIPYLSEVTVAKLRMIERAESVVRSLGFRVCRVRHHTDDLASLEIGVDELPRAFEQAVNDRLVSELTALGYRHVTIDPRGYRQGSLNEGLRLRPV